jgi:two-component system, NarL family, response regulator LiaR
MRLETEDRYEAPAVSYPDHHVGNDQASQRAAATLRVMVVDDHPMFRLGVTSLMAKDRAFVCVGEADSAEQALRDAPALRPDVILMDLELPGADGITAIEALRERLPSTRFVVMANSLSPIDMRRAMAAGITCVVLKTVTSQELVAVLHAAHKGQRSMAPEATEALIAAEQSTSLGSDLTQRERKLLALMAHGLPNQEISHRLEIGLPTVKFHVTNILSKLNAANRTSAVLAALRLKLVRLDEAVAG